MAAATRVAHHQKIAKKSAKMEENSPRHMAAFIAHSFYPMWEGHGDIYSSPYKSALLFEVNYFSTDFVADILGHI